MKKESVPVEIAKASRKSQTKNPYVLPVVIGVLTLVCVPYIYYAVTINAYLRDNAPADYRFVTFDQFWKTVVGAIATQMLRFACHATLPSFFSRYSKGEDDETKRKYTLKACEHTYRAIYFSLSAFWGWSVLKDSPYLFQSLGGPAGGDLTKMALDTLYLPNEPAIVDYSLFTWGFHLGNFI